MISYAVYKVMHLVGVLMVFLALGGVVTNAVVDGRKHVGWRRSIAITHGVGMLLSLVGGFGLLARLGLVQGLPGWVWVKLAIWLFLGLTIGVLARKPAWAKPLWVLVLLLGGVSAYLAGSKPF